MNRTTGSSGARREKIEAYKSEIKQIRNRASKMFAGYKVSIYTGLGENFIEKAKNYFKSFDSDYAAAVEELFKESALGLARQEVERGPLSMYGPKHDDATESKIIEQIKSMNGLSTAKKMELIITEYETVRGEGQDVQDLDQTILQDTGEEAVEAETFTIDNNVVEPPSNIDESEFAVEYQKAKKYFQDEKQKILTGLLGKHVVGLFKDIKSEQDLKDFANEVIKEEAKNCGRDLAKLAALEKKVNEFFDNQVVVSSALSANDREDLIELIADAKKEVMKRKAIDEMVEKSFLKQTSENLDGIRKNWGSQSGVSYEADAINWMIKQCDGDVKRLTNLENNVRKLLDEGLPIEPSESEKAELIVLVTTAKKMSEARKEVMQVVQAIQNTIGKVSKEGYTAWTPWQVSVTLNIEELSKRYAKDGDLVTIQTYCAKTAIQVVADKCDTMSQLDQLSIKVEAFLLMEAGRSIPDTEKQVLMGIVDKAKDRVVKNVIRFSLQDFAKIESSTGSPSEYAEALIKKAIDEHKNDLTKLGYLEKMVQRLMANEAITFPEDRKKALIQLVTNARARAKIDEVKDILFFQTQSLSWDMDWSKALETSSPGETSQKLQSLMSKSTEDYVSKVIKEDDIAKVRVDYLKAMLANLRKIAGENQDMVNHLKILIDTTVLANSKLNLTERQKVEIRVVLD